MTGATGPTGATGVTGATGPAGESNTMKCLEINAMNMWRHDPGSTGTIVASYSFIPRKTATMTPIIGWGITPGTSDSTQDAQQVITFVESPCNAFGELTSIDICTTLHFVLTNTTGVTGFGLNWEQQLLAVNNSDTLGPNIPGTITTEQFVLSEPLATDEYRHYCVKFLCKSVNIIDCPALWLGWRRIAVNSGPSYSSPAHIVAATICCTPHVDHTDCTASIGYWKTDKGVLLQCYPIYMGTYLGTYTTIVQSSSEANTILSKNTPGDANNFKNVKAQLLAAKFAIECNQVYMTFTNNQFVTDAVNMSDVWLANNDNTINIAVPSVPNPLSPSWTYPADKILEMFNNDSILSITSDNGGPVYHRPVDWPMHC